MDTLKINTELLTVEDGLSQGLISSIIQDKEGLMWMGTKDGLNKYDGYAFTVYRHEPDNPYSLPGNYVTSLAEDDNGNFWIGTDKNGLCLFDKRNERFYPVKLRNNKDVSSKYPVVILKYAQGKLLVEDNSVVIYDVDNIRPGKYANVDLGKATIYFDEQESLPKDVKWFPKIWDPGNNTDLLFDWMADNSLWCQFQDSILVYSPDASGFFRKTKAYSINGTGITPGFSCSIADVGGHHLLVSNKELVMYDFIQQRLIARIAFNDGYPMGRKICRDVWGNYFILGLETQYYFNTSDLSLKVLKGVAGGGSMDRSGILWMCTSGNGVMKYDYRKQFFQKIERIDLLCSGKPGEDRLFRKKAMDHILYTCPVENEHPFSHRESGIHSGC